MDGMKEIEPRIKKEKRLEMILHKIFWIYFVVFTSIWLFLFFWWGSTGSTESDELEKNLTMSDKLMMTFVFLFVFSIAASLFFCFFIQVTKLYIGKNHSLILQKYSGKTVVIENIRNVEIRESKLKYTIISGDGKKYYASKYFHPDPIKHFLDLKGQMEVVRRELKYSGR